MKEECLKGLLGRYGATVELKDVNIRRNYNQKKNREGGLGYPFVRVYNHVAKIDAAITRLNSEAE